MSPTDPRVLRSVREMQGFADAERSAGRRLALVPTMGALHEGHLSLVRLARSRADRVVVSIFVNPTQFGPGEDYPRYPRRLPADLLLLRRAGADLVFAPSAEEIYPPGNATRVVVDRLAEGLCGRHRPGHFEGVASVVARLFLAAKPHVAVFGEKDYQQLVVIRRMAHDLHFDVEVLGAPIVREPDGLAMSSRNEYLTASGRRQAAALNAALGEARALCAAGERSAPRLLGAARERIAKEPLLALEYAELRDADTLAEVERVERPTLLALCARVDAARLIDNVILEVS